jgi:hypothetical protein
MTGILGMNIKTAGTSILLSRDECRIGTQQALRLIQEELTKEERRFPYDRNLSCMEYGCLGIRLEEAVAWAQRAECRIGVQPVT